MRFTVAIMTLALGSSLAPAAVKTETVTYTHDGVTLKGHLAYDDAATGKRPGVLVVHEWWGLNDYAKKRVTMLAELGYVAFAADMYGDGKATEHPDQAGEMMSMVQKNQAAWQGRAVASLKVLQQHPRVDATKLAAIGYCFGGSTALQLAYTGADVKAIASFHGALPLPTAEQAKAIKAKVLICHGAEDSFVTDDACQKLRKALSAGGVDYEMDYYGGARHSFTVQGIDARGMAPLKYDPAADKRSWARMLALFSEVFAQ